MGFNRFRKGKTNMAKIQERKAAKDYPANGIKKGDTYFFVAIKTGPRSSRTIRSLVRPKRYELTTSAFKGALWRIEDEGFNEIDDPEGLRGVAEEIRDLGGEQQESFDNMPEGLQQGDTGQLLEERATGCEEWADAIEQAADDLESELEAFDAAAAEWEAFLAGGKKGDEPDTPEGLTDSEMEDADAVAEARKEIVENKLQEAQEANPGMS